MFDLFGQPLPPTPAMTDPLPMRVFRLNECDWWMARSLIEAKADYLATFGPMPEDEAFDDPRELSDADLDRLQFVDTDVDENPIKGSRRSFREELQQRIEAGANWPQHFASTEY